MGSVVTVDTGTGRVGIVPPVDEVAAVVPFTDGVRGDPIGFVEQQETGGWLARPADGTAPLITATIGDAARWLARHPHPRQHATEAPWWRQEQEDE